MSNVTSQIVRRRSCSEDVITVLKKSESQSLKTWVNTFQNVIDGIILYF